MYIYLKSVFMINNVMVKDVWKLWKVEKELRERVYWVFFFLGEFIIKLILFFYKSLFYLFIMWILNGCFYNVLFICSIVELCWNLIW